MKLKFFEPLKLKFEQGVWAASPEFAVIDTILEKRPDLITMFSADVMKGNKNNQYGRADSPSVEQIVRLGLYKEIKSLDYRELFVAEVDSRICADFAKIDPLSPYSFQTLQKYISKMSKEKLEELMYEINKIAIAEGIEDVQKISQDSTVTETNIHYPTNNSLVWDCIHESQRLLTHLKEANQNLEFRNYTKSAKKTYYLINNTKTNSKKKDSENKTKNKRQKLFKLQLITFRKSINQVSNILEKGVINASPVSIGIMGELKSLLPLMEDIYCVTESHEIKGEKVKNDKKIFSIYERHTEIIVKGSREVKFGRKLNIANGKSNLVLACDILKGNPADSSLFKEMVDKVIAAYGIIPRDNVTDGAYASKSNVEYAQNLGIKNIVFNKVVGSLQSIASSKNMETRLKKWRSASEAIISNIKRGFDLFRCNWKGDEHFKQKVFWSIIAYNIRVITGKILALI